MPRNQGRRDIRKFRLPSARQLRNFRIRILEWFNANGRQLPWRRASARKYELVLAETLLQRTRAEAIATFLPGFLKEFPSWRRLSIADPAVLQNRLRPIGLWRRRSASIQALAKEMVVRRGRFPNSRDELENLPGVGQYIANAILLFYHGFPEPLLDVNMARVLERVFGPRMLADIRRDPYLQALARRVILSRQPKELNWAILDFAAIVCLPRNPLCHDCTLASMCLHRRSIQ
jgi:A/G-specific adenine glycosylase